MNTATSSAVERAKQGNSVTNDAIVRSFFSRFGLEAVPRQNVYTFKGWAELGRVVCRGEASCRVRTMFETDEDDNGETRKGRSWAFVFHEAQTRPASEPENPDRVPLIPKAAAVAANEENDAKPDAKPEGTESPTVPTAPTAPVVGSFFERLRDTAARRRDKAERETMRKRQTNTPRRARIAAGVLMDLAKEINASDWVLSSTADNWPADIASFDAVLSAINRGDERYKAWRSGATITNPADTKRGEVEALEATRGAGVELFCTREVIAEQMARAMPNGMVEILEPSAGRGALIQAVLDRNAKATVYGVEVSNTLHNYLASRFANDDVSVTRADFLQYAQTCSIRFDGCVMNPPFSEEIKHIKAAFGLLANGAPLAAIASVRAKQSDRKDYAEFREWLEQRGASITDIPSGSFEDTNVPAVLILVRA